MKNVRVITALAKPVLSFFLIFSTTTNFAMHSKINLKASFKRMKLFCQNNGPHFVEKVTASFNNCEDLCTRDLIKKLVDNYQKYTDNEKKLDLANDKTIESLIGEKRFEIDYNVHPYFSLWLWTEKCKNKPLKKLAQLLSLYPAKVSKTFANLAKENYQNNQNIESE